MKTIIQKLEMDQSKTYQRKKISFIHPNPINQFKETHSFFRKEDKKIAKYEYEASKSSPTHKEERYKLAGYFVDVFMKTNPVWGSFKFQILK